MSDNVNSMKWNCEQLESRLNGYLEGRMAALELREADQHARSCVRCLEWFEARQARALLLQLDELETPPGFETRVLARTLAPPEQATFGQMVQDIWQALRRPRVGYSVAAAAFSFALVFMSFDVPVRELEAADLNPVNIYRAVDRKAHLAYASGVRYLNELRVVYEIRNQWAAIQGDAETEATEQENGTSEGDAESQPGRRENRLLRGKDTLRTIALRLRPSESARRTG